MTPERGEVIAVVSGKGGVGKTNLAANLAVLLARQGLRTCLLDADFGLVNADVVLGITPTADLASIFDERRPLADALVSGPERLSVLCGLASAGGNGAGLRVSPARCVRLLERLDRDFDVLIVDCGSGVPETVVAFALACDRLILLTTPEPTAVADAYATLKVLSVRGVCGRVGVVVNMAHSTREASQASERLRRVAERFLGLALEDLGAIAYDRHVMRAVCERTPFVIRYPRCRASVCVAAIAQRLGGSLEPAPVTGLWGRVASIFL